MRKSKGFGLRMNVITMTVGLAAGCAARLAADDAEPIAWYKMDAITQSGGARRIADTSGNNRELALGEGCWLTNGVAEPGLWFDGTAAAWSSFACPALGSRTVSMLFRREQGNGPIYEGQPVTYPYIFCDASTMRVHFDTGNNNTTVYVTSRAIGMGAAGAFTRAQWHHLAWVYEETPTGEPNVVTGVCKFYRNGILSFTSPDLTLTNTSVSGTAYLGNHSNKTRPVHGILDEVRVYDTALTDGEIKREALRAMETGKAARLAGRWTMEEVVTPNGVRTVPDVSDNGGELRLGDGCMLTDGVDGLALRYNGAANAFAVLTNGPAVSSWSFAGWARQDRASETPVVAGNLYPRIFQGTGGGSFYFHPSYSSVDNNVTYKGYGHAASQTRSNVRPSIAIWVHYAVVTRMAYHAQSNDFSSVPTFYVNGKKAADGLEQIAGKLMWDTPYSLFFGNAGENGPRPFHGEFDDFRFYDGALSDEQVQAIYRGVPPVSAGADFATVSEKAALQGQVGDVNESPLRFGFNAQVMWTLVSAPEGGEAAAIETPASATTRVTLPTVGEYIFRLTVHNGAHTASDEVTVSRVAAPAGNQPPTVTLDAAASVALPARLPLSAAVADADVAPGMLRVAWTKVSGPGGVYFSAPFASATEATFLSAGSYVLKCTADDGAATASADIAVTVTGDGAAASLTNGLVRHYPVNAAPFNRETVGGSTAMTGWQLAQGVAGYGLRSLAANGYADTKQTLPELGPASGTPTNITHLSFSLWMYHDTADTNVSAYAALVDVNYTLGIYYRPQDTLGFTLFQQGPSGVVMQKHFARPAVSPANRWTHVYACFDRQTGDTLDVYADGVPLTSTGSSGRNSGRVVGGTLTIGGMPVTVGGLQGAQTNSVSGGFYSRVFPGVIDEVRIYNRKLSDAEIAALALPPARGNRAPLAEPGAETVAGTVGGSKPLAGAAFDDGVPDGAPLACRWRVVAGAAAGITFADATQPTTMMTFNAAGTYGVQLEVSDGERTTYSDVVAVAVTPGGTVFAVR